MPTEMQQFVVVPENMETNASVNIAYFYESSNIWQANRRAIGLCS